MTDYQPMAYYLALPWSFDVQYIEDPYAGEHWTVFVKELPGCKTHGATPQSAMQRIPEALESYLLSLMEDGEPILEPVRPDQFKGQISYRTSPAKHYRLAKEAQRRGISINKLIDEALDDTLAG